MRLFTLILLLCASLDIWACAAIPKEDYSQTKAINADVVVVGMVVSGERIKDTLDRKLKVKASIWLKGAGEQYISIREDSCWREFSIGSEYILLLREGSLAGSFSYTKENMAIVYDHIK